MWSEWTYLITQPQETSSTLTHLPPEESKKIVSSVATSLLNNPPPVLDNHHHVTWCLEVLQYGLLLNPCESLVDDCVSIYCHWFSVLLPHPVQGIPDTVLRDPNYMARIMFPHLYLLFENIDSDQIAENGPFSLRVTLCIKVLRMLEEVGRYSTIMDRETWHSLLLVLLSISDHILGQPGVGGQLCYTVVSVLLHTWLTACTKYFPGPTMWATLVTKARGWRHRVELVSHWSKVNMALLSKQLVFMYGPRFPSLILDSCCSDLQLVMSPECVAQSSYRFLHILGNICELSQPGLVSSSQPFFQAALSSLDVIDPHSHPCLDILPDIFLKAVCGVSQMVDAYLGCDRSALPLEFSPLRSRCNSILHMFGPWLFQAALLGTTVDGFTNNNSSDKFFEGRAEALGTLCIIFNAKKFCEEIETPYLARFFMAIQQGLHDSPLLTTSILRYSGSIMVLDLPGANLLVPDIVQALISVVENTDKVSTSINPPHLRLCSIQLAKTVAAIPTHFAGMNPARLQGSLDSRGLEVYRADIFKFFLSSLQTENVSENCQQLLCALAVVVELQAAVESNDLEASKDEPKYEGQDEGIAMSWITSLVRLVSHRLLSSWSTDYQTSLAAIELLSVLAQSRAEQDGMECKRVLRWICDFISLQCNRPPPAHSRDLHSSIIAAFQTCNTWLVHRPTLLEDKECLTSVLEVAELAISGSKSKVKASDTPIPKEEKILSPISKRVRCAAEDLISTVMQKVGYTSICSLSEKVSTQIDEEVLHEKLGSAAKDPWYSPTEGYKYFMCDRSYILSIAKKYENNEDSAPSAIVLFRGATGKSAWMFELKNTPNTRVTLDYAAPRRPEGHVPKPKEETEPPCNFPHIDASQSCAVDSVIPILDEDNENLESLNTIISQQIETENDLASREGGRKEQSIVTAEPIPSSQYQTCRLVLSHLGLLSEAYMDDDNLSLIELDASNSKFWEELKSLDMLSTRNQDTILVYYVKNKETSSCDILSNSLSADLPSSYLTLLSSLGWQVELGQHPGWAGQQVKTSDDSQHILYWADEFTELAILVPCQPYLLSESSEQVLAAEQQRYCASPRPGIGRMVANRKGERMMDNQRVVVAWLENMEDATKFPLSQLVPGYNSVCVVIFLQPISSGLVRVKVTGWNGKPRCVAPLGDGMVVSPLVLGQLVRQTAVNMSRRTRMESDCHHHTPSTRRRAAIQAFGEKFALSSGDVSRILQGLFM